jgi:hypothetical protein
MQPEELSELDLEQISAGKVVVPSDGDGTYDSSYYGGTSVSVAVGGFGWPWWGGWGWGRRWWGGNWAAFRGPRVTAFRGPGGRFVARGPRGGVAVGRRR